LSTCHLAWVAGARGLLSEGIQRMICGLAALGQTGTSLARFCQRLRQLADTSRDGVHSWLF
jgi:hypothetical protein